MAIPNDRGENLGQNARTTTIDLYPAALRAIEEDDLDKMKTIIELESFSKESLDNLLYKACERSKDISLEENFVKQSANISDLEEEQSMLSICRTARKDNEKMLDLLVEAESQADSRQKTITNSKQKNLTTPTKPHLESSEKNRDIATTPELPKFKSKVCRALKY